MPKERSPEEQRSNEGLLKLPLPLHKGHRQWPKPSGCVNYPCWVVLPPLGICLMVINLSTCNQGGKKRSILKIPCFLTCIRHLLKNVTFLKVKVLNSSNFRYTQNGILHMLDRNKRIKPRPERFQNCKDVFDLILTCEERVYDQVVEGKDPELINGVNFECLSPLNPCQHPSQVWEHLLCWSTSMEKHSQTIDMDGMCQGSSNWKCWMQTGVWGAIWRPPNYISIVHAVAAASLLSPCWSCCNECRAPNICASASWAV